ncbi:MAG: flagellar hook protein FlgE [Bryobacterales bacterium]|nr:flagellar hook protein FlgE [Bryobacterales bacterium]MBV9400132.1 flagellar hook protein FlgE [Bryobacterales bacterium]
MFTSFSTALSALHADSTAIDVVGNNLANLNTTGFKTSDVSFQDLVSQSMGSGQTQLGFGVGTPITQMQFSQGALQATGGALDAAIQGDGFFVVANAAGATEYTRAGNFQVDANGNLTTATGQFVQGWMPVNGVLNPSGPTGNITVPVGSLQTPAPTTNMSVSMNLNAAAATGNTFSTSVQVYDSLGNSHVVSLTFTKSSTANQWQYSMSFPNSDLSSAGTPVTGTLTFNSSGVLTSPAAGSTPPVLAVSNLADGAANMNINWNLFDGTTPTITQFSQPSATSAQSQDGSPAANLTQVSLVNGGKILAQFSNGSQVVVGQLAMASILNPESLVSAGNNNYGLSAYSAPPAIGIPGTGGRGTVVGGSLESSNADIAREFTNLIVFQRSYEANAKVVTTVDQLSQDTINLRPQ